jgi:hypothetical protein
LNVTLLLQGNFFIMRLIYIAFTCCLLAFAACNNGGTPANSSTADTTKVQAKATPEPVHSKLNDAGTQMLTTVVGKYYTLKNALVATKAAMADSAAIQLGTSADSLQVFLQKDTANYTAIKLYMDTIISQSKAITTINDESCEKQRLAFSTLSSAMYELLKNVDLKNAGVYYEHCPMAFNEKGAYWLSDDSDIKNPYFGKKMLECGEVTDVIK